MAASMFSKGFRKSQNTKENMYDGSSPSNSKQTNDSIMKALEYSNIKQAYLNIQMFKL